MMHHVALLKAKVEAFESANIALSWSRRAKQPDSVKEEVSLYSRDKSYGSREKIGSWESKRCRKTGVSGRELHQGNGDVAHAGSQAITHVLVKE
jgi:hypothetical protein